MSMCSVKKSGGHVLFRFCAIALILCGGLLVAGCSTDDDELIDDLMALEISDYQGRDVSKMTIDELEGAIERFRDEMESKVRAAELAGAYHKILGVRYLNMGMYRLAYDQFKAALDIFPSNHVLAYYAGVCAARTAKSLVGDPAQQQLFAQAEEFYLTALDYSPNHTESLYGLAVLYVFELNRPSDAREYLERIVLKESRNFDALFLLARVYAGQGRVDDAIRLYRQIAEETIDEKRKASAEQNIRNLGGRVQ